MWTVERLRLMVLTLAHQEQKRRGSSLGRKLGVWCQVVNFHVWLSIRWRLLEVYTQQWDRSDLDLSPEVD